MLKYGCSFDEAEDTDGFTKVAGNEELPVPGKNQKAKNKPQDTPEKE